MLLQRLDGGGEPGAGGRFRFARWSVVRLGCGGVSVKAILFSLRDLTIMAYPEVAVFNFPHYDMSNVIQPNDYLVEAKKWKDAGAQIIGGCCGTTVEHIKLLNEL